MFDPEEYDRYKQLSIRSFSENPVAKLTNGMKWKENEVILDYGCGPGKMTNKRLVPLVTAHDSFLHCVDISRNMIEYAGKKYPNPRVQYQVGNLMENEFPFPREYFDKIFAIHMLNWFPNFREALARFYKLLKPGGYFGFIVGSGGYLQNKLLEYIAKHTKWSHFMEGYQEFDFMKIYDYPQFIEESYRESLTETGFLIVELKTIQEGKEPVDLERLVRFYVSLNPYLPKIPQSQRAELESDYRNYIKRVLPNVGPNVQNAEIRISHEHQLLSVIVQKPKESEVPNK